MAAWMRVNRDKLVHGLGYKVSTLLDNLVAHGYLKEHDDDYQEIRAERTPNESARRLLDVVESKGRTACEHLQQTVMSRGWCEDCTSSGENLTSDWESSSGSASEIQPRRRREARNATTRRRQRREPHCHTNWWKIASLIGSLTLVVSMAGVLIVLFLLREVDVQRASPNESARTSALPPVVLKFKDYQKTKIEARARDNALPWLDFPPEPVGKLNVNLVLAEKTKFTGLMPMEFDAGLLRLVHTPRKMDVATLFHPDHLDPMQTPVSRILVTADAGMGKTFTFAKMMPMRWLKEPNFWPQFDLIFVVLLGNPQTSSAKTLQDFLFSSFGADVEQSTRKEVTRFVSENPERVLVICDALDEGQYLLSEQVQRILNGTSLSNLRLLITSRPCKAASDISSHMHRQAELLGIEPQDFPEFVLKHLGNHRELANALLNELENRPDMKHLMSSPMIASLVCSMFSEERQLPASKFRLYEIVVLNLIRRAGSKPEVHLSSSNFNAQRLLELSGEPRDILTAISVFAACAEEKKEVYFTKEIISTCFYQDDHFDGFRQNLDASKHKLNLQVVPKLGLLSPVTVYGQGLTSQVFFVFIHKTFQEFFAAFFMQRFCLSTQLIEWKNRFVQNDVKDRHEYQEDFRQLLKCFSNIDWFLKPQ